MPLHSDGDNGEELNREEDQPTGTALEDLKDLACLQVAMTSPR